MLFQRLLYIECKSVSSGAFLGGKESIPGTILIIDGDNKDPEDRKCAELRGFLMVLDLRQYGDYLKPNRGCMIWSQINY